MKITTPIMNLGLLKDARLALEKVAEHHGLKLGDEWDDTLLCWKVRFFEKGTQEETRL